MFWLFPSFFFFFFDSSFHLINPQCSAGLCNQGCAGCSRSSLPRLHRRNSLEGGIKLGEVMMFPTPASSRRSDPDGDPPALPRTPGKEVWLIYHFRKLDLFKEMPQAKHPASPRLWETNDFSESFDSESCSDSWGRLPGAGLARGPQKEPAWVLLARGRRLLKCIGFDFLGWKWGCRNNARRWASLWTRAML